MEDRRFPIRDHPSIPWAAAERASHSTYRCSSGPLEEVARRGGWTGEEFACFWFSVPFELIRPNHVRLALKLAMDREVLESLKEEDEITEVIFALEKVRLRALSVENGTSYVEELKKDIQEMEATLERYREARKS